MIHAYASAAAYARHIYPVWKRLCDVGEAGTMYAVGPAFAYLESKGVKCIERLPLDARTGLILVASYSDSTVVKARYAYLEHGAGQTYSADCPKLHQHGSYSGGSQHERCALFLCPSQRVADRWLDLYPATPVAVVGSPVLDAHNRRQRVESERKTVGFAFHWNGLKLCPETGTAFFEYRDAIRALHRTGRYDLLGHGHPRAGDAYRDFFTAAGISWTPDPDEVLSRADLIVADNTSLMMEAAALDIPVLTLNASFYRRDVEHGLRFWSEIPGLECSDPVDFQNYVVRSLEDPPGAVLRRREAARAVYASVDGEASERAVAALLAI